MRRSARLSQSEAYWPPQPQPTSPVPQLKQIPSRNSDVASRSSFIEGQQDGRWLSGPTSPVPQLKQIPSRNAAEGIPKISLSYETEKDDRLAANAGLGLVGEAYGKGGIPNKLQRSISADCGLRHYARLNDVSKEIDQALSIIESSREASSREATSQNSSIYELTANQTPEMKGIHSLDLDGAETEVGDESSVVVSRDKFDGFNDQSSDLTDLKAPPPSHPPKLDDETYQRPPISPPLPTLPPLPPPPPPPPEEEMFLNGWAHVRYSCKEFLAEWLGTTVAFTIGISGAMVKTVSPNMSYGNATTSSFAWGFAVMIGIYIAGGISGAHLNPVITIVLCIYRGFPWKQCGVYILGQLLGALTAGIICYGLYHDAIIHFEGSLIANGTGVVFYSQPKDWVSIPTAFFNEFVATGILTGTVLALGDDNNTPAGAGMGAFIIGLVVTALSMAFGYQTGACLNPVRDLGPRLVAYAVGYGHEIFTAMHWWWLWGPWGACLSGGIFGAAIYDICIYVGADSPVNYATKKKKAATISNSPPAIKPPPTTLTTKKWEIRWWRRRLEHRRAKKVADDVEKQAVESKAGDYTPYTTYTTYTH